MLVLALDTAGPDCAAALAREDEGGFRVLARRSERLGRGHAERLLPMVGEILRESRLTYADLQRIAVTTGPGSFTGVRVGLAAARALALALDIPAVGVGSLDALMRGALPGRADGSVAALLDARRGEVYAMARDIASRAVLLEPIAASPETIAARLGAMRKPLVLTGAGAPLVLAALGEATAEIAGTSDVADIAEVAQLGIAASIGDPPLATYVRGADAKPQTGAAMARQGAAWEPAL
jgi:tRNA threonylcarbamoyladenosine biosynthesis protein TsaB